MCMSNNMENEIKFVNEKHKQFFYEAIEKLNKQDVYHIALVYCLGINSDTRSYIDQIYDFRTGLIKPECLEEGWQTSGSMKVVRLAFNLYCNGTPSINNYKKLSDQLRECQKYTVEDLFCCGYAPYFWEAIKLRYPEYTTT